jgi:hypothetical protein
MLSRRELYAAGEPFGECATAPKVGGGYVCGGGGGGGSESSSTTTTNTTDKRMVVDTGIGISSESSNVNVTTLDAGIVNKALDTVQVSDATNKTGFTGLLELADKLFTQGGALLESTQQTTMAQIESINAAANDREGAIDQKTIIVLAIAGAAALVLTKK